MQENRGSSSSEQEVSLFFSSCGGNLGRLSSYSGDGPSKLVFVQRPQDPGLLARENLRFSSRLLRAIETPLEVRQNTQSPFLVATTVLGLLSIFKESGIISF